MDAKEVGSAIAFLRKEKGYTQSYLASLIGVSDKAVSKWERGMGTPDISLLTRLSIILDIDIECLLEGNLTRYDQHWKGMICTALWTVSPDTMLFDKPLLDYILSYCLLAGISHIRICTNAQGLRFVESRKEYWESAGLTIHCTDEEAFTPESAASFASRGSLLLIHEPVLLYGLDLTKYLQRAMSFNRTITSLVIRGGEDNLMQLPLSFISGHFLEIAGGSIADFSRFRKKITLEGRKNPVTIGRGMIALPLKNAEDVLRSAAFVRTVQEAHGLKIADLHEIAVRRNLIDPEQ